MKHDDDEPTHKLYPKVSKIIFDEKTGTLTLRLASEEEIALDEELKKENGEQGTDNREQRSDSREQSKSGAASGVDFSGSKE